MALGRVTGEPLYHSSRAGASVPMVGSEGSFRNWERHVYFGLAKEGGSS